MYRAISCCVVLSRHLFQCCSSLMLASNRGEPGHEKMCLMSYAKNKGEDETAHPRSLISAFGVHCLDSIISLDSIPEISRL